MAETPTLKLNITNEELMNITSPRVISIMKTIKAIQKRLKDPDNCDQEFIIVYEKLAREFQDFVDDHAKIFTQVVRGENLNTLASVLYYKDKVDRGLMTEDQLSDMLATKFLPANLKKEADARIKEMKQNGTI